MSFVDSFWTPGYKDGLDALFEKLQQGVVESDEVLALAAARAEIEEQYGVKLRDMQTNFATKRAGFGRDDGASMRRSYEGILDEMTREGEMHVKVGQTIRKLVVEPFSKWSAEHDNRIDYSRNVLNAKLKQYESHYAEVQRAEKRYLNKCRLLEDLKDQQAEQAEAEVEGTPDSDSTAPVKRKTTETEITSQELVLGGVVYNDTKAEELVQRMIKEIPQRDTKVTILGTYSHTSTGSEITEWVQKNLTPKLSDSEKIGQDLVNSGLLRLVGAVGSKFVNSTVMTYQWRPKAFEIAGISFNAGTFGSFGETLSDTFNDWRSPEATEGVAGEKLARDVRDLDQKYRKGVTILDNTRCELEELIVDHLKFLQNCELDRLKAIKAVFLDFISTLSNVVPSIKASVDNLLLYQETVKPEADLRYIMEAYSSGPFSPHVTIYDNYYSSADANIFGMDLELRSRGDHKPVPYIVSTILAYLDKVYPRLENDEVRLNLWLVNVPLKETHALRKEINTTSTFDRAILSKYEPPVVVSVLKLYLLELPDSAIPSQYYDVLKAISQKSSEETRITGIQNTLAQLRVSNIATLDVLTAHIKRLVTIAKADAPTIEKLAKELGRYLIRPKVYGPLNINDTFPTQFFKDILNDRDRLFKELRKVAQPSRQNSINVPRRGDSRKDSLDGRRGSTKTRRESVESRISRVASLATGKRPAPPVAETPEQATNPGDAETNSSRTESPNPGLAPTKPSSDAGSVFEDAPDDLT